MSERQPPHLRVVPPPKRKSRSKGSSATPPPPTDPPQPPATIPGARYRLPDGPGFLETIGAWVNRTTEPEADATSAAGAAYSTVLERYRDELAAFKVAVGRREAAVMTETMRYLDDVRWQLMEKADPRNLDMLQLMNLAELLQKQMKFSNDLIIEAVEGPRPTLHIDARKALMTKLDAELPASSRDRLRRLFKWVLESKDLDQLLSDHEPDDDPSTSG